MCIAQILFFSCEWTNQQSLNRNEVEGTGYQERFELEDNYPNLKVPKDAKLYDVADVISADTIVLKSEIVLKLVGVRSPTKSESEFVKYFKQYNLKRSIVRSYAMLSKQYLKTLLEGERVAVIEHSYQNKKIIGYLFIVNYYMLGGTETRLTTNVNESVISSGWCVADSEIDHPYFDKYFKLQEMAKRKRVGLWGAN